MEKLNLSSGATVYYRNIAYKIVKPISLKEVMARELNPPHEPQILPIIHLTAQPETETIAEIDISQIDKDLWDEAMRRYEIIKPFLAPARKTFKQIRERAQKFNVSPATIYRWISDFEQTGTPRSLVPKVKERGGKNKSRLSEEVDLIINNAINDIYLDPQKYPIQSVYQEISENCKHAGLPIPHLNTVRARIEKINQKLIVKKREGKSVRETRGMPGKFPYGTFPLAVVQIDHTKLDILLVDNDRHEIGRPYLTLAVDVFSRMVAGFYLSFEAPSFFNTGQCLLNAILPKETLLAKLGIEGEWPIYGLPKTIHTDNAKEFRGVDLQRFCDEYSIELDWRPVGRPEFGGHVERLLGTISKRVHTLPGTTFSNIRHRGAYLSSKASALTIDELEHWLVEYIVNTYHKSMHETLKMTPEEKFMEGIFGLGDKPATGLPSIVKDSLMLRASLLPSFMRTVQTDGITIDYITYFSDILREWIRPRARSKIAKPDQMFLCRRDPRDLSKIYFYDPKLKTYFEVPYRDTKNPKIDLTELRHAIASIKQEQGISTSKSIEEHDIFKSHNRLKQIASNAIEQTKSARRKASSKKYLNKRLSDMPLPESHLAKHTNDSIQNLPLSEDTVFAHTATEIPEFFDVDFLEEDA